MTRHRDAGLIVRHVPQFYRASRSSPLGNAGPADEAAAR
jgi:hypothetical protein